MTAIDNLFRDVRAGKTAPIYLIHGEESFFADRVAELFENLLPEQDRAFNLFTFYPLEKEPDDVMDIARRYPMMSDKIIVLVKEVQTAKGGAGKWINRLAKYAENPSPSTILVLLAKGTKVACKDFTDRAKKSGGVIIEIPKTKDGDLKAINQKFIKNAGLKYEGAVIDMLVDNIGNDLAKLYNEINKLKLILPPGATVTPESVEKNIGISREFNNFELCKALACRDALKAIKIIRYFNSSQKENPWVLTLSAIFSTFSNALIGFYTDRTDAGIQQAIGARHFGALNDCKNVMRNYSPAQLIEIMNLLREADANGKGNRSRLSTEQIMETLILNILFATGKIN